MMRKVNLIVIHCSATTESQDIGRAEIDQWHKQRGWAGIGYHWVIRRNGMIERGRPEEQPGSHTQGKNRESIGVCMVGGVRRQNGTLVPQDNFTPAQWASLRKLVLELLQRYPGSDVRGHRDFANKACPSFSVSEWLAKEGIVTKRFAEWNSAQPQPKPLSQSRTVHGAAVAGAAGVAAGGEDVMNAVESAKSLTFLAEPGTWLSLLLIALIVGGTIYAIWGRKKVRDEEGV